MTSETSDGGISDGGSEDLHTSDGKAARNYLNFARYESQLGNDKDRFQKALQLSMMEAEKQNEKRQEEPDGKVDRERLNRNKKNDGCPDDEEHQVSRQSDSEEHDDHRRFWPRRSKHMFSYNERYLSGVYPYCFTETARDLQKSGRKKTRESREENSIRLMNSDENGDKVGLKISDDGKLATLKTILA